MTKSSTELELRQYFLAIKFDDLTLIRLSRVNVDDAHAAFEELIHSFNVNVWIRAHRPVAIHLLQRNLGTRPLQNLLRIPQVVIRLECFRKEAP